MFRILVYTFSLFFISILSSCNSNSFLNNVIQSNIFDTKDFIEKYPQQIDRIISQNKNNDSINKSSLDLELIKEAYNKNNHNPIWYTTKKNKISIDSLLKDISDIEKIEGIDIKKIQPFIDAVNVSKNSEHIDTIIQNDIYLSIIYSHIVEKMLLGNTPPKTSKTWLFSNDSLQDNSAPLITIAQKADSIELWTSYRSTIPDYSAIMDEVSLWQNLKKHQNIDSLKEALNSQPTDSLVRVIMQKELNLSSTNDTTNQQSINDEDLFNAYQKKYGLKITGKKDEQTLKTLKRNSDYYIKKLHLNLERLRWIPKDLDEEYIYVNIPLMELVYKKSNQTLFHTNVIVGKSARPTPSMNSKLTDIVFNPPWGVPPTILKNDVVPGVSRSGGSYLARKGLRAYDSRGRDVTSQVNGSNIKNYRIAQPPGANNALGEIKFNFPNTEAIFIHDTNNRGQFKNENRALSSGCIRTDQPKDLAEIILKEKGFDKDKINSLISKRKTEKIDIDKKISIYILYLTTHYDISTKTLIYLKDIYNYDKI